MREAQRLELFWSFERARLLGIRRGTIRPFAFSKPVDWPRGRGNSSDL